MTQENLTPKLNLPIRTLKTISVGRQHWVGIGKPTEEWAKTTDVNVRFVVQVYPTILRSVGLGACSGMARTGAVLTPYVAQVLMKANLGAAVGVYVVAALGAAVVWEERIQCCCVTDCWLRQSPLPSHNSLKLVYREVKTGW